MKLITFLFICLLAVTSFAQNNPYLHTNAPNADESFATFKKQLSIAIKNRDIALLSPLLADTILTSINGVCPRCPKNEFIKNVDAQNPTLPVDGLPYYNNFWEQAAWHIRLGFAKKTEDNPDFYANIIGEGEHLISPPYNYYNNYDTVLLLDSNVNIFRDPTKNASVVGKASYTTLPTVSSNTAANDKYDFYIYNQDEKKGYIKVKLKNGTIGYINESKTSQTIFKQMTIAKQNGQWKIVLFYHPPGC